MEEEAVELHRSIERKIKAVQRFERAQKALKVEKRDINLEKYNTSQEAFKKIKQDVSDMAEKLQDKEAKKAEKMRQTER